MDQQPAPLPYARPLPAGPRQRPPMYSLILTVLASAFLILLGLGFLLGLGMSLARGKVGVMLLWLIISPIFIVVGVRSMIQTVHFLRGGKFEGDWQKWMFAAPPEPGPHHDWDSFRPPGSSRP